jgi:hypothetical protein
METPRATAVEAADFGTDDPNTRYASQTKRTCRMMISPTTGMILVGGTPMLRGHGICLDGSERHLMWMIGLRVC